MAGSDGIARRRAALVTGGSGGIGRAVTLELARCGYDVAFTFHSNAEAARELGEAVRALGAHAEARQVDVAAWDEVDAAAAAAAAALGGIDLVVHTAGELVQWKHVGELEVGDWTSYIASDLNGAFYVVRAALPHLRRRGGGCIVLLSSIAAQMCQPRNVQGAVAKAGVEALMRVLAREEARNGIRAVAVSVGLTDTPMAHDALARWGTERAEKVIQSIPLGRIGRPEEVARLIAFLASEDGAYITGKVIQIDGGQLIAG